MKPKFKVGDVVYFTDFSYTRRVYRGRVVQTGSHLRRGIDLSSGLTATGPFEVVDFKRHRTQNFLGDKKMRTTITVRSIGDSNLLVATFKRLISKKAPVWNREFYGDFA